MDRSEKATMADIGLQDKTEKGNQPQTPKRKENFKILGFQKSPKSGNCVQLCPF